MSEDSEPADAENEADADSESEETEAGFEDGDFVRLEYTARTVEGGELVDTTDLDTAEEEGIDTEEREFGPRTIVIGADQIFPAVEDALRGAEVGDEGSVVVDAEEAFGEYEEDQVRTVATDRIPEDDRYPGAQVQLDDQQGRVVTLVGGRARVDFNHPLAGEDIEYDYEVAGEVTDRVEQAQGLLRTYFDVDLEMHIETDEVEEETVVEPDEDDEDAEPETEVETVEKETLYVESTPQLQFNQQWMFSKQQVLQEVIDRVGVDRVIVQEIIEPQSAGPMGDMGGMMGGGGGLGDLEEAIDDPDVDAEELVEELEDEDAEE